MLGNKMSGAQLEHLLNENAVHGWQLKAITASDVRGRVGPGGVEGLLVTFERIRTETRGRRPALDPAGLRTCGSRDCHSGSRSRSPAASACGVRGDARPCRRTGSTMAQLRPQCRLRPQSAHVGRHWRRLAVPSLHRSCPGRAPWGCRGFPGRSVRPPPRTVPGTASAHRVPQVPGTRGSPALPWPRGGPGELWVLISSTSVVCRGRGGR